jgi:hypothetical protein
MLLQNADDLLFQKATALHAGPSLGQNELQTGLSPRSKAGHIALDACRPRRRSFFCSPLVLIAGVAMRGRLNVLFGAKLPPSGFSVGNPATSYISEADALAEQFNEKS